MSTEQSGSATPVANAANSPFPTERIELPSAGKLYSKSNPLSEGAVDMKYMSAKEEDILTSTSLLKNNLLVDRLLQSLITTKFPYNELLLGDKNHLMMAARILAYGKDYNFSVTCPSCGHKTKQGIDLTKIDDKKVDFSVFEPNSSQMTFTVPRTGTKLTLRLVTVGLENDIDAEMKGMQKALNAEYAPEVTTRLKYIITSVDGKDDQKTIRDYVDTLRSVDSQVIRKFLRDHTPGIDLTYDFKCPNSGECSYEDRLNITIDKDFFWPGV